MANNNNQNKPQYVESDLVKSKIVIPPRNRKKEIDITIYSTNQSLSTINVNKDNLAVQAKFELTLKLNQTGPVGAGALKPVFGDISQTETYRTELAGFVYQEIPFDNVTYVFATQSLATDATISKISKFRITSYQPIFHNGTFLYASVKMVPESLSTIPSLQKINWSLVQEFLADVKTKFLKIEIDDDAIFYSGGFKFSVLPEKDQQRVSVGWKDNSNNTFSTYMIKLRQFAPLLIDNLTMSDLNERLTENPFSGLTGLWRGYNMKRQQCGSVGTCNIDATFDAASNKWTFSGNSLIDVGKASQQTFFGRFRNDSVLQLLTFSGTEFQSFLSGTMSIGNYSTSVAVDKINAEPNLKKVTDLDIKTDADREYLIIGKALDLSKFVHKTQGSTGPNSGGVDNHYVALSPISDTVKTFPKTRLLSVSEFWNEKLNPVNGTFVFEIELQSAGYNPKIEIASSIGKTIKITQYDETHAIIGSPSLSFTTASTFDDSKVNTVIQL